MRHYQPHKILVFTRKGWNGFPRGDEETAGSQPRSIAADLPANFETVSYCANGHTVQAFGLRHPQFAVAGTMHRAVTVIMSR